MKLKDLNQVMVVEEMSFPLPWSKESFVEELNNNKLAYYVVAKEDSNILGYGGMWCVLDEGHITNIAVHPSVRNKGVGSKILHNLYKKAKRASLKILTLEVRASNISAQLLYEKFGFVCVGIRKKYYADNEEDALIMTLNLNLMKV
jgi:ribosomal-protein-alanine N-acetyltransferase